MVFFSGRCSPGTRPFLGCQAGSRRRLSAEVPPPVPGSHPGRGIGAQSYHDAFWGRVSKEEEKWLKSGAAAGEDKTSTGNDSQNVTNRATANPPTERNPPPKVWDTLSTPPCVPASSAGDRLYGESAGTSSCSGVHLLLSTIE